LGFGCLIDEICFFKMTSCPSKVKAMAQLIACLFSKTDYFCWMRRMVDADPPYSAG